MINYYLKQLNKDQYYLICMDYNNILSYLDEIEKEALIKNNQGELIIDQLLVVGNGRNRFITCQFSYGKIKLNTAKNIDGSDVFKCISLEIFRKYFDQLKYSILTDSQLEQINLGQII